MRDWSRGEIEFFALERFDERYGCYRLPAREAEADMVSSLRQFGQLSPVVCRWQEETPSLIDGFRRLHAARQIAGLDGLTTRLIEIDDREAKVAMYRLNLVGRRVHVLEEAWLVYALVREDGLSQLEVAQLMARHKSWVYGGNDSKSKSSSTREASICLSSPSDARRRRTRQKSRAAVGLRADRALGSFVRSQLPMIGLSVHP